MIDVYASLLKNSRTAAPAKTRKKALFRIAGMPNLCYITIKDYKGITMPFCRKAHLLVTDTPVLGEQNIKIRNFGNFLQTIERFMDNKNRRMRNSIIGKRNLFGLYAER